MVEFRAATGRRRLHSSLAGGREDRRRAALQRFARWTYFLQAATIKSPDGRSRFKEEGCRRRPFEMKRPWPWAIALVSLIAVFAGTQAATAQNAAPAKKSAKKKTAAPKKPSNKKYRTSSGKPTPKAAAKKPAGNAGNSVLPMSNAMSMATPNAPKPAAPTTS